MCECLLLRSQESRVPVPVYLLSLLHFALFSYHFIYFFASNCLRISWFTDLLEGGLSYNPPIPKSAFLAFDHFLIEPPPLHCNIEIKGGKVVGARFTRTLALNVQRF